jgi:hypothetical protein
MQFSAGGYQIPGRPLLCCITVRHDAQLTHADFTHASIRQVDSFDLLLADSGEDAIEYLPELLLMPHVTTDNRRRIEIENVGLG